MSTDINSNNNKKLKTDSETEELDKVQQYLLECPLVPKESRAIQAALQGLTQERKRMERDAKLLKKFSSQSATAKKSTAVESAVNETPANTTSTTTTTPRNKEKDLDDDAALMEWQDVAEKDTDDSLLGRRLSQSCISNMAKAGTTVSTPTAAVLLALHAALMEVGFVCTGIPFIQKGGGFAPPIRPIKEFVPPYWDKQLVLRYRKDPVGAVNLQLHQEEHGEEVTVHLTPANSKEPNPTALQFPLENHVNLESFQAALAGSPNGRVLPALHYKALPVLMTNFLNTFDLGGPQEEEEEGGVFAANQTTFRPATTPMDNSTTTGRDPLRVYNDNSTTGRDPLGVYNPHEPPSISQFQPRHPRGDFAGDLMPGLTPGLNAPAPGNLMGPNHPMFSGAPSQGGLGMRPRFDPYGPPGGPTDPNNVTDPNDILDPNNRNRPRPPPGGSGDPNPDHQRPPNDLSNNMFS